MLSQSAWKTSSGKSVPCIKQIRTVPDLISPQNKIRSATKIRTSRIQWKAEQKLLEFVPTDAEQRAHDLILNSLQFMPKEIVNSLNLQHYENSFQFFHSITQQELEFQLISSLEQLSQEIIEPLFVQDNSNNLGVSDTINPYKRFNIKAIPRMIEILNGNMQSTIKLLLPNNGKLCQCIEYLWKYFIFMIDLLLQFSMDRSNKYIVEQVNKLQTKLSAAKAQITSFETRVVKMTQEFELALTREKQKYYELQGKYEKINAKANELERLINEDVKTEGRDDSYKLKKNVKELEANLKNLEQQFTKHEEEFVYQLTNVAVVAKSRKESILSIFRNRLSINVVTQIPGDMAFCTMFTDHPWVQIFCQRQLIESYVEAPYVFEEENKMEILHKVLMMEQQKVSPCIQLQEHFSKFEDLYKTIITIIEPFEEATQAAVQLNNIFSILFNIQGQETIEIYYINQIKRVYQEFYSQLTNVQLHSRNPEQVKLLIEIEDENLKHKIVKLNLNIGRNVLLFQISKQLAELYFAHVPILAQLTNIYESRKEITMLHFLSIYALELAKQSKMLFENKLLNFNIPEVCQLGKQITYEIFPEFKLNSNAVQSYIIQRYYYLYEQQIKLNKEYMYRLQNSNQSIILDREAMMNGIRQLRYTLLFHPSLFASPHIVEPTSTQTKQPRRQSSVQQ